MIKVIKHRDPEPLYKMNCQCGCVFIFEKTDVNCDKDGTYVVCPDCNMYIATELAKRIERSES